MFVDEVEIIVSSGRGGDGMVHFHREKYVTRGGPDGGDGGRGGDLILEVLKTMNTLNSFRHRQEFRANNGAKGGPTNMTGKSADDLVVMVPPGTIVYDAENGQLLGDLVIAGERLIVANGGRGGLGNQHFATSRNQAPRVGERGEPGMELRLKLELKLIADVGIVGVPNAGKSSLLAASTNAKPKVANYPFTTLEPNLGVAALDDDKTLVLADIPGLIEGAHMGIGLGDTFLKHIQRTKVIIHLLDGLSDDPLADFSQINSELALFDPALVGKFQIVGLNKIDMPEVQERWPKIKADLKAKGYDAFAISALARTNLQPLLWKAYELLQTASEPEVVDELPVYRPLDDKNAYTITKEPGGWRLQGAAIERAAEMTYWEYDGSVRRFQHLIETLGIDKSLRDKGIQEGDTVFIGDNELEWQD